MVTPNVIRETTAENQTGFPMMLQKAVRDTLGIPIPPRYVVFEESLTPAVSSFRANVHIVMCPLGRKPSYFIQGGEMSTPDQAIQIAAWKSLARLRHSEPAMANSREYRFFPSRPPDCAASVLTTAEGEVDPAVISIVAYGTSLTMLSNSLMAELRTARRNLVRAQIQLVKERNLLDLYRRQDPEADQSQLPPQENSLLGSPLDASVAATSARARQQIPSNVVILEGIPVAPAREGGGYVDTVLRLSIAPPDASGR